MTNYAPGIHYEPPRYAYDAGHRRQRMLTASEMQRLKVCRRLSTKGGHGLAGWWRVVRSKGDVTGAKGTQPQAALRGA